MTTESRVPRDLIADVGAGSCVLFVGAGVTTGQATTPLGSFYDHIRRQCGLGRSHRHTSFSATMQYFCDRADAGNKNRLVREVIQWIEPLCADTELRDRATAFYEEIATIPFFRVFVTTNWDPLLERTFDLLFPIVEDKDMPFWDDRKKQVIKLHGCITRPHSLLATTSDYQLFLNDAGLQAVRSKLRDLLATKTFIFVGYSMQDSDLRQTYDELGHTLGPFRRTPYVVDPAPPDSTSAWWKTRGVVPIEMTAIEFARELVRRLESEGQIPPKRLLQHFLEERKRVLEVHSDTARIDRGIGGFASAMYQDGLLEAIPALMTDVRVGITWDELRARSHSYIETVQKHTRKADAGSEFALVEACYLAGWAEVYFRFIARNYHHIPRYLHPHRLRPIAKPVYF